MKRRCFTQATLEGIAKILGDTSNGLTGSEIQYLLQQSQIEDIDSQNAKWKRLYSAFANYQNTHQCSNKILYFTLSFPYHGTARFPGGLFFIVFLYSSFRG